MRRRVFIAVCFAAISVVVCVGCVRGPVAPLRLTGVWHAVSSGDTVSSVAGRYGADPIALAELNDLPENGALAGRRELFIPKKGEEKPGTGAEPAAAAAAVGTPTTPARTNNMTARTSGDAAVQGQCGKDGRPCLAWPVDGKMSSKFGSRSSGHHDGIDIVAKRGVPVRAAAEGKVLYSGDEIAGYGNLVIIRHDGGIITVYAHNDSNLVKEGASVKRGERVARVGNSGSANGTHLHFEIRVAEQPKDPLLYLPSR